MRSLIIILLFLTGTALCQKKDGYDAARQRMVEQQIVARGISDYATLQAMRKVPRHLFVPPALEGQAYSD